MFKDRTFTGREIYKMVSDILKPLWDEEASSLSKFILTEVLDVKWMDLITSASLVIEEDKAARLERIIERLLGMEPVQYILGYTYFLNRKFKVSPEVLIPRPETEELVHAIINNNSIQNPMILDIGTGSGCIGISLSLELDLKSFTGIDKSSGALKIAETNASRYGITMKSIHLDILKDKIPFSKYHIIVSNPPYVKPSERKYMKKNVLNYEPSEALFVPEDNPLIFYKKIVLHSASILKKDGVLFFEANEMYCEELKQILLGSDFKEVKIIQDIHGKDRIVYGIK